MTPRLKVVHPTNCVTLVLGLSGISCNLTTWVYPIFWFNNAKSSNLEYIFGRFVYLVYSVAKKDPADKKTLKPYAGKLKIPATDVFDLHNR